MLIWHIYYDRYAWLYNEVNVSDPMRVDLIEADGKADGYTVKDDAFPTSRGVNSFNGFVTWGGDSLGLEVYDIKIVDDHVEFETRGNRVSPVLSSSSSAKSSSSVAKSSSSKAVSSSSKAMSSSSKPVSSVASSSSVKRSSSSVSSSSSKAKSSSSSVHVFELSSSSDIVLISERRLASSAVRFFVDNRVLRVNANFEGRKTVNLFDVNGTLLLSNTFADQYCEISMDALRGKSFVIVTLESGGQLIKTKKIRVK